MRKTYRVLVAAVLLILPCAGWAASPAELAAQVKTVLKTNCYRCHGERGAAEGGMAYVTDLTKLVERKKVVPGNAEGSKLYKKIASEDDPMPPRTDDDDKPISQRPSKAEIALVRQWIEAGAPQDAPAVAGPARVFISDQDILVAIQKDLDAAEERSRQFLRYYTITHLYNAGLSDDELQTYRGGLSKLVNSLSWGRQVVVPVAVDAQKTIFRIDLRDYKWNEQTWTKILGANPYSDSPWNAVARDVEAKTKTELPYVRADWFVFAASRPPLYYDVLEIPASDSELEKLLKVDATEDIRTERVARAGFNGSGVSRNNRLIERHDSPYGAYWKSYDFKKTGSNSRKNLFTSPLGPGDRGDFFEQDGGEIIFNLPNGLQAYMLVNSKGERIDKGPTEIVSDPKQEDRAVVNGVSCMSCHIRGMIEKTDQIRQTILGNTAGYDAATIDSVKALYPVKATFDGVLKEDADRFLAAVAKTGAAQTKSEPVVALSLRFTAEVDASLAAAEAGISPHELADVLSHSPNVARELGVLTIPGGTVQRDVFAASFGKLASRIALLKFARTPRKPDPAAVALLQSQAAAGDAAAMYALAIRLQVGNDIATDLAQAQTLLTQAADKGNTAAMLRLADMFSSFKLSLHLEQHPDTFVLGVKTDPAEAARWYTRAADAGSPLGMALLGYCCEQGFGVPQDADKAHALFSRAFQAASAIAETDGSAAVALAMLYQDGKGTPKDKEQELAWLSKATELGDPYAVHFSATVELLGSALNGKTGNFERILGLLQEGAEAGNTDSIALLAASMKDVDPALAAALYQKAADSSIPEAMLEMAKMYRQGLGVPKDDVHATQMIGWAVSAGNHDAMIQFAECYDKGLGIAQDHALAVAWMHDAAALETVDYGPAKTWLKDHGEAP